MFLGNPDRPGVVASGKLFTELALIVWCVLLSLDWSHYSIFVDDS